LTAVVEDTLKVPNGIAFSLDGRTYLHIRHWIGVHQPPPAIPGYQDFNVTNHHAVCAFSAVKKAVGKLYLTNKKPTFQSKD
jgi:hypothetical protein